MKKHVIIITITLFSVGLFSSCSTNQQKETIKSYIQTIFDAEIDLNLKFNDYQEVDPITAKDSISYWENKWGKNYKKLIQHFDEKKESVERRIVLTKRVEKAGYGKYNSTSVKELKTEYKTIKKQLKRIKQNNDFSGTFIENKVKKYREYKNNPDKILLNVVKCNYTIENPLLDGRKVTINKKFYLTPNNTKVVKTEDI